MPTPNSTAHPIAIALRDQGFDVSYASTVNPNHTTTVELTATNGDILASATSTATTATQATLNALADLQPLITAHA